MKDLASADIRSRRKHIAQNVVKATGRNVYWAGGRLYFADGQRERAHVNGRRIPDLPKPGKVTTGELRGGLVKTPRKTGTLPRDRSKL